MPSPILHSREAHVGRGRMMVLVVLRTEATDGAVGSRGDDISTFDCLAMMLFNDTLHRHSVKSANYRLVSAGEEPLSISGMSRCISGAAGPHTIISPACHDQPSSPARYARSFPRWCLDPFRSYTRSFKLSSTPANLTIPTRTSIIALPQMTPSSATATTRGPSPISHSEAPKRSSSPRGVCVSLFLFGLERS